MRGCEACGVHDDGGAEARQQVRLEGDEVAGDGLGVQDGAFGGHEGHEPGHAAVGVDDGGEVGVGVDGAIGGVDVVVGEEGGVVGEAEDAGVGELVEFRELLWGGGQWVGEEEGGCFHLDAGGRGQIGVVGYGGPDVVRYHAPAFGLTEGDSVCVGATDGRRVLPEGASDLGCETLLGGERGPFLGYDGDVITSVEENP